MLDFKCFPWYHISSSQIEKCWRNVIEMFLIVNCHWCEKGRLIIPKLSHISIHLFPQWSSNCTCDARLKLWLNTANDSYFCYFIHFIHIYSSFSNYLQSHFKSGYFHFPSISPRISQACRGSVQEVALKHRSKLGFEGTPSRDHEARCPRSHSTHKWVTCWVDGDQWSNRLLWKNIILNSEYMYIYIFPWALQGAWVFWCFVLLYIYYYYYYSGCLFLLFFGDGMGWGGMLTFMFMLRWWCHVDHGVGWGGVGC